MLLKLVGFASVTILLSMYWLESIFLHQSAASFIIKLVFCRMRFFKI